MKKAIQTCMLAAALSLAHSGMAQSTTVWDHTDFYDAGGIDGIKLGAWSGKYNDTWEFNILTDGYDPATESVTSAIITLELRDDNFDKWWAKLEIAKLLVDGSITSIWEVDTGSQIISLTALTTLSNTGLLSMELKAIAGDFYFDSAQLDAHDMPAVPVPAAVWLFGSGLLGLIGVAKAKHKA